MRAAGWERFSQMEATAPLQGYADIGLLPCIPLQRYLVTSGFRRLQDSKIDALGIRPWFEQVLIDAIDAPPTGTGHGKQALFEQILAREGCTPRQMLVVGDNPLSELAVGRALGATTVQTVRPGVEPWPLADHRVEGLQGLLALLERASPEHIVVPRAGGRPASPVFFPARFRAELLQRRGDEGGRGVRDAHPEACLQVEMPDPRILADIDTPEQYEALLREEQPRE